MASIHKILGERKQVLQLDFPLALTGIGTVMVDCKDGHYMLTAKEPVKLNGRVFVGQRQLKDKSVIVAGKDRFIFYDEEGAAETEKNKVEKVKTSSEIEKRYNLDEIKQTAKELLAQFVNKNNATRRLKNFASAFCEFIKSFCGLERSVFYVVERGGKRWSPAFAIAPERQYRPPMKILKHVYDSGQPVFVQTNESAKADLSLSIIQNEIKSAICFPIYPADSITCLAVFYGDTKGDPLDDKKFLVVNYLCQYVAKHIAQFARSKTVDAIVPKLTQIDLPGGEHDKR